MRFKLILRPSESLPVPPCWDSLYQCCSSPPPCRDTLSSQTQCVQLVSLVLTTESHRCRVYVRLGVEVVALLQALQRLLLPSLTEISVRCVATLVSPPSATTAAPSRHLIHLIRLSFQAFLQLLQMEQYDFEI